MKTILKLLIFACVILAAVLYLAEPRVDLNAMVLEDQAN